MANNYWNHIYNTGSGTSTGDSGGRGLYTTQSVYLRHERNTDLYTGVFKHTGGDTYLTGSLADYGAGIMFASGSPLANNLGGIITLTDTGSLNFLDLRDSNNPFTEMSRNIIPISVAHISSSTAEPAVYLFKRRS